MKALLGSCALALCLIGGAASASAAPIYSNTTATPDTQLPGHYDYTFTSLTATSALTSISLQGYNTLDGQNYYEDDFSVFLNNTLIYKATFNLGGGGDNVVFQAPTGSTYSISGQTASISLRTMLQEGSNTLTLSYDSLPQPDHYGYQPLSDEGFGINSVAVSNVPLPASAPLFGAALLALGAVGYGLKRKTAAAA